MTRTQAPKINEQRLKALRGSNWELSGVKRLFREYQKLVQRGVLNQPLVGFLALRSILQLKETGHTQEEIQSAIPEEWHKEATISVPKSLLIEILSRFEDYLDADPGWTFGECFGIEGRGQGKKSMKDKYRTRQRRRTIGNEVAIEYLLGNLGGNSKSLASAVEDIAEKAKYSTDYAKRSFKLVQPDLWLEIKARGVTED